MTSCPFSLRTTYFFFVYSSLTVVVVCVCFNILGWYKKNNNKTLDKYCTVNPRI